MRFVLPILLLVLPFNARPVTDSFFATISETFTYDKEAKTITGLTEDGKNLDMIRIYSSSYYKDHVEITKVNADAFIDASYSAIMISNKVIDFLPSLEGKDVYYTGTEVEFTSFAEHNSIDATKLSHISYQACDEGFVEFWWNEIRTIDSICDLAKDDYSSLYEKMITLYDNLEPQEKVNVNSYDDEDGSTIKKTMEYIKSLKTPSPAPSRSNTLSKQSMLRFILFVAGIGMTSICVFYLLKDKDIIE